MKIGIDIGSTTIKCVVLNLRNEIIHSSYERHFSKISEKFCELIEFLKENYAVNNNANISITGSAGMGLADDCGIPFVQEVFATRIAIKNFIPDADAAIELGGEDAKILFLTGGLEVRMNGSCAGGTGAFIDQMASLLHVSPAEMDLLAAKATRQYTVASRC
ncbi:MAG: 2-hydroxyglutaryl-CoA dehydratase, partial [Oscillospiraceae bacterium]|nr:2-hydroxyglutaryl-CoA dehydratase [Oscillospiraceae bacterium]